MKRVTVSHRKPAAPPANGLAVRARKTIAAPAAAIFAAWADAGRRAHWLVGVELKVEEARPPGALRLTCTEDDSDIAVAISARGRGASGVVVNHTRLASAQLVAERKHCWKEMLRALKHYLEQEPVGLRPPRS